MGYQVSQVHSAVTINGTATGYIGVTTPTAFPIGGKIFISGSGPFRVTEQTSTTIRAFKLPSPPAGTDYSGNPAIPHNTQNNGGSDLSAFTTSDVVDLAAQVVPGRTSP